MLCRKCGYEFDHNYFAICPYCLEPVVEERDGLELPRTAIIALDLDDEIIDPNQNEKACHLPVIRTAHNSDDHSHNVGNEAGSPKTKSNEFSSKDLNNSIYDRILIRDLNELNNRTINALARAGIFSIGDLFNYLEARNCKSIRDIGEKAALAISDFAEKYKRLDATTILEHHDIKTDAIGNLEMEGIGQDIRKVLRRKGILTIQDWLEFRKSTSIEKLKGLDQATVYEINDAINRYKKYDELANIEHLPSNEKGKYPSFQDIDVSNEGLTIDALVAVGISKSTINVLKHLDVKTFGELKNSSHTYLVKRAFESNISQIEEMEKLLEKPAIQALRIYFDKNRCDKDFRIYLRRAEGYTLQEIADNPEDDCEQVTRERIRQIENKYFLKIKHLIKHMAYILMDGKSYITSDDISEMFSDNGSDRAFIYTCKMMPEFVYFDCADTFVLKTNGLSELKLAKIVENFINDGINFYDSMIELEEKLITSGYEFLDRGSIVNFLNKYNYSICGEYVFRKKPSYGFLCTTIVQSDFPKGIKLNQNDQSPEEDLKRLRELVQEKYGDVKLPSSDRALSARIASYLVRSDRGMVIHPDHIHLEPHLLRDIKYFIDTAPKFKIYYAEIFAEFEGILKLTSNVDNRHFLHGILQYFYPDAYHYSKDYLKKGGASLVVEPTIPERINEFIVKQGRPVSKSELAREFPGFTESFMAMRIFNDDRLIQWENNYYSSMDLIQCNDQDTKTVTEILSQILLKNGGYSSDTYFYENMMCRYNIFLEKNDIKSATNLYYIVANLLNNHFDFRRPHIATKGKFETLSTKEIIMNILENPEILSYEGFMEIATKLRWSPVTSASVFKEIEQEYIRISNDKYIVKHRFSIEYDALAEIRVLIERKMENDVLPIYAIDDYDDFPEIGYDWNKFLLGSIVDNFCLNFNLVYPLTSDRRYQKGIITHAQNGMNSYSQIVAHLLLANNIGSLSEGGMLSFLIANDLVRGTTVPRELADSRYIRREKDNYIVII